MDYLDYGRSILIRDLIVSSSELIEVADEANNYIRNLVNIFSDIGFDIFYSLGQRNISGFIGEIYKNILAKHHSELLPNPHPDGRPDIIALDTQDAIDYYKSCFTEINGRRVPIKDRLTPFKYGGIEVKCSIGSSSKIQTDRYLAEVGHNFNLYEPRVGYLNGITWWAHHSSSSNLLGLYYDYYAPANGTPQILAALYSELNNKDWNAVSHGNPNNKKTSNTSLNKNGLAKMKSSCMFSVADEIYVKQLRLIGVQI